MPTDPTPEPTEALIERLEDVPAGCGIVAISTELRSVIITCLREQQALLRVVVQERDTLRRQLHAALSPVTPTPDDGLD